MADKVLVTGITGYIGQHCGAELLKNGYEVIGSIRSQSKAQSVKEAISNSTSTQKLDFIELDLLNDEGWSEAMEGCKYVLHVASPFVMKAPKDENDLIKPAVEGTLRVLKAAKEANISRVVLTSSVAAMTAGRPPGSYGPDVWSDLDSAIGAYAKSKTLAEKAAWDEVRVSGLDLVVINPAGVMGPGLSEQWDAQSVEIMSDMLNGNYPMVPDMSIGLVDVRDVAQIHVAALTAEGAVGNRFIASTSDPVPMMWIAELLKQNGHTKVSTRKAPTFLIRLMSLFSSEAKGMLPFIGKPTSFDISATTRVFKCEPRPLAETILEMAKYLGIAQRTQK